MPKIEAVSELHKILLSLAPVPEKEWRYLHGRMQVSTASAKDCLVQQGSSADRIFYVHRGLLKVIFTEENGDEFIKGFVREGQMAAPYGSILTGAPANISILALEDSELLLVESNLPEDLYARHPCWQQIGRKIAESLLIEKERREYQMLTMNAEARYLDFKKHYRHLVDRIPQYEIASYLGITPVSLSQIRRKIATQP